MALVAKPRPLRTLPWVSDHARFTVPGLGTFALQPVGSTAHTTGMDVYFHREGSAEAELGYARYELAIDDACHFRWARGRCGFPLIESWLAAYEAWTAEIHDTALQLLAQFEQRDPSHFMFFALSRLELELKAFTARRNDNAHSVAHLTGLLANPSEPRSRPNAVITDAERADRRERWAERIAHLKPLVAAWDAQHQPRVDRLSRMIVACRTWSRRETDCSIFDALDQARAAA